MIKKYLPLFFILLTGLFLYTFKLDSIPNGLYVDEAVSGYNSYSILKTGADEYGKAFPFAFRFFGSYSPPLYVYLSIPFIYFFDLNVFSVRILSAILGVLSAGLIYIFLKNLELVKNRNVIPLIGSILFLTIPWHFFYSRIGYEIYLGAFLFFLSTLLIFLGFKNGKLLILGLGVLSLSTYGAHTEIYLAPLFFIVLGAVFYKDLLKHKKYFWLGILLGAIIQIPHLLILNTQVFLNKNSLFYSSDISTRAGVLEKIIPFPLSLITSFSREFLARFITYFSPNSLFFRADPDPQRSLPGLSVFYFWMVVPYLTGFYLLLKNLFKLEGKYLFVLTILSVLPASLTGDPFSTQRALPLLFPLFLICILGIDFFYNKLNKKVFFSSFILLTLISVFLLWRSYFLLFPAERAKTWGYGAKELSEYIKSSPKKTFIIDQNRLKPLYIQLAFYNKIDPFELQKSVNPKIKEDYYNNNLFVDDYKFENVLIKRLSFEEDIYKEAVLIGDEFSISDDQAKEHFLTKIFEIKDPLNNVIYKGFETNPGLKCHATNNPNPQCKK